MFLFFLQKRNVNITDAITVILPTTAAIAAYITVLEEFSFDSPAAIDEYVVAKVFFGCVDLTERRVCAVPVCNTDTDFETVVFAELLDETDRDDVVAISFFPVLGLLEALAVDASVFVASLDDANVEIVLGNCVLA